MAPEEVQQDITHYAWVHRDATDFVVRLERVRDQLLNGPYAEQWIAQLRQAPGLRVKPALVLICCDWVPSGSKEKDRVVYAVQEALRRPNY